MSTGGTDVAGTISARDTVLGMAESLVPEVANAANMAPDPSEGMV